MPATDPTPLDRLELPDAVLAAPPPPRVDALVVGGGPAGLSAATWLGRYRRRTLVVDAGAHRNRSVEAVHGVLGRDPVVPARLREDALRDLEAYPHVSVRQGTVTELVHDGDGFLARVDGTPVRASRLVLATGVRDRIPEVEGFAEHYGADVQHCPTCEGFEARDRPVVVIGWGAHVPAFATELLDWASAVVIVTGGEEPEVTSEQRRRLQDVGIELVDDRVDALLGTRGALRAVRLAGGRELPAGAAFFSIGHDATVELAVALGCELTDEGVLAVDRDQRTTVEGVFAAGDVTPGMQLVAVAIGEGATAGVACARSLQGRPTVPDAPPPAPAPEPLAPDGS